MKSLGSVCSRVVVSGVLASLVACSGGNSSPSGGAGGGGGGTTYTGPFIYVIQNPTTSGTGAGTILQFSATATGSISPLSTITAPANTSFYGLATDGSGNIYVSTRGAGPGFSEDVREYAAGSTGAATPLRILQGTTTGVTAVDGIASNAAGEIFVAEDYGGVQAFSATATGNVAPTRAILGAAQPGGGLSTLIVANAVAPDASDNLYVVNEGAPGLMPIVVFGSTATGNVVPIRSLPSGGLTTIGSVVGITTDTAGNLYVTSTTSTGGNNPTFSGSILEFGPTATGNVAPIRSISGSATQLGIPAGIKVDAAGNIYVVSAIPSGSTATVSVLKFAATASGNVPPVSSFTSTAWTNPDDNGSIAVH